MEIRRLTLILVFALLQNASYASNIRESKENQLFLNYAYSICIGSAFRSNEIKSDANRSANGYMEFSNISLDAYQELRDRIDIWLAKKYLSKNGGSLQVMKCNDFFNSGEIQKIYKKYNPCKSKDSWFDVNKYKIRCE